MTLAQAIRRELALVADPARAAGAQAYMKSEMPFLGVGAVPLRRVCRQVFEAHPISTPATWRRTVLSLWRNARFREERYAAIELTGAKRYRHFQTLDTRERALRCNARIWPTSDRCREMNPTRRTLEVCASGLAPTPDLSVPAWVGDLMSAQGLADVEDGPRAESSRAVSAPV